MKRACLFAAVAMALGGAIAACGGGDDDDGDVVSSAFGGTSSPGATARATVSPSAGETAVGTPVPQNTLSPEQATAGAAISGGNASDPTQIVGAVTPLPGVTPIIDPTEIASPEPRVTDVRFIVDMDASTAGIQTSRDVNAGDTFKVGIVLANVPNFGNNGGGINAVQFTVNYDKTKIVAPTIVGGESTDRNPDLNLDAIAGGSNWSCLPAPEGDKDDPGGAEGDGNPSNGQAFLSCFTGGSGQASGTMVIGVITFQAVASGSTTLTFFDVIAGDFLGQVFANCNLDPLATPQGPIVPCEAGTANVR